MSQLWWDTARAGGIVAWSLLAASVVWGLLMSTSTRVRLAAEQHASPPELAVAAPQRRSPRWMLDVHRFLGGLAVVFVGVHVTRIVLDSYVHFGLAEVLVPLASSWHPVAVAWGIVGLYLLLAVELTSLARRRLSRRVWRTVHAMSFPTFAVATIHGLTAGTDRGNLLWQTALWGTVAAVVLLTVVRLRQLSEPPPAPRAAPAPWPAPDAATRRVPTGPPQR